MKHQFWPSTFLIPGLSITPMAFADADPERQALAKIIHKLNILEPLIKRAETNADQQIGLFLNRRSIQ